MRGICAALSFKERSAEICDATLIWVPLNRTVMGLAIGIFGLRLPGVWKGILLGIALGSVFSHYLLLTLGLVTLQVINFFATEVFGLIIEFLPTVVFNPPAVMRTRIKEAKAIHA